LINGEIFVDNETAIEQAYQVENQYFNETPNLDIKIRFRIKPGLMPRLEVIDMNERILNSRLIDRDQTQVSETLGFIPMGKILKAREEKSNRGLRALFESDFIYDLQSFSEFIIRKSSSSTEAESKISAFRSKWKEKLNLNPMTFVTEELNLISIYQYYSSMEKILEYLFKPNPSNKPKKNPLTKATYRDLLLILGFSYALTNSINLDFIFDAKELSKSKSSISNWDIRIQTAARISCSKNRQNLYLNLFDKYTEYKKNIFYKTNDYIWGYARLLLWYVDINDRSLLQTYQQHFINILNHCLTLDASIEHDNIYIKDALIALIYLLTFREINPQFVERGSASHNQSKRLCTRLNSTPISSTKANIEVPLHQFFEQLLDGSATQKEVDDMIKID